MGPPDATQLLTHFRSPEHRAGGLVGRARELADLTGALDAAATGDGRLVLLAGEPGIGKTRLADALTGAARERGFRVAWGRCWEAGGAPPHWPWVQVLRSLTEGLEGDALAAALGPHAAGVLALAPELGDRLTGPPEQVASGGDGDGARFAAWDATASFLGAAAAAAPLMIVLDDVHTADRPSLLFLRFLARTLHDRRLLIVATLREAESSAHGELFDELARDGGRLPLRGLGDDEVARLAAAHAGRRPPAAFARELRRVTDGNPFFVVETVRLRVAEAPADPFALPVALPAHALAAVRRRLDPLPAGARDLLAVAAVAGREFDAAVVGSLASVDPDEVAAVLDAATLAGLVEHWAGGHRFTHALVRDALYDSLAPSRRAALHEALAVALEQDGADSAHIAHHYSAAGSPRAAGHARAAGDDAAARLAYEDAALHYEHALEGALAGPDRCEVLLALGDARMRTGATSDARTSFAAAAAAARELGDAERLAAAALGFGSGGTMWADGGVDTELATLLEEALDLLPAERAATRSRVLARLADALIYAHDWERTGELSAAAIEAARASGDRGAQIRACEARLLALMRPATLDERLALADELERLANESRVPDHLLAAWSWQVTHALELGDRARLDAYVARFARVAAEQRQPHMLWGACLQAAMTATVDGRLADAERLAHEALALAEGAVPLAAQFFGAQVLSIRRDQGRLAEVEPGLRAMVGAYPAVPSWRATWAAIMLDVGLEEAGRRELESIARADFLVAPDDYEWLGVTTMLAQAFARLADRPRCRVLYERLLPYADRHVVVSVGVGYAGSVARHLGLLAEALGDADAARVHFERALAAHEAMGARAYAARTRLEYGRMLARLGSDPRRARELLSAAARDGEAIGMAIAADARALLEERAAPAGAMLFRREGDAWAVGRPDEPLRLRHSKGLAYVAELLGNAGAAIPAVELAGGGPGGDAGPALDAAAKGAYRERLAELRPELDEAERWNDSERAARLRAELDAIAGELAGAVGLGGRDRRAASGSERARVSVTKAIRSALGRIAEHDPALAEHLDRSIRTGTLCAYEPPARDPIAWLLS